MEYKVYQKLNNMWTIVATYYHDDSMLRVIAKNSNFKIEKIDSRANESQLALF